MFSKDSFVHLVYWFLVGGVDIEVGNAVRDTSGTRC